MDKDILKVKVMPGHERNFERYCLENDIFYKPYPRIIKATYRVECKPERLRGAERFIKSLEDMPEITLS